MSATRIYANPSLARRANGSLVVVIIAFLFGAFEIWRAVEAGPESAGNGYLFAALFIGGGIYGLRQVMNGHQDAVVWLDIDEAGGATVAMWKPFTTMRLTGKASDLTSWRPYAKEVRRNVKVTVLLADHPGHPRPLEFELGKHIKIEPAFKTLAADAAVAFSGASGAPA